MIYLLSGILCSTLIAIIMRISNQYTKENNHFSMLAVNYLVCILLAVFHSGLWQVSNLSFGNLQCFAFGIINGFFYLAGFVLYQLNIGWNGVVLSATFMKLGVLVPTLTSVLFFGERPTMVQIIGFSIAVVSIIAISIAGNQKQSVSEGAEVEHFEENGQSYSLKDGQSYSLKDNQSYSLKDSQNHSKRAADQRESHSSLFYTASLLLLLLSGGAGDVMSKIYEEVGNPDFGDHFLLYTFIFAFLFCLLLVFVKKQGVGLMEILFGAVIAVPNFYSARFLLQALGSIPAVIACPTYNVATMVLTSLAGLLIFRERLNRGQWMSIGGILVALVLLNMN